MLWIYQSSGHRVPKIEITEQTSRNSQWGKPGLTSNVTRLSSRYISLTITLLEFLDQWLKCMVVWYVQGIFDCQEDEVRITSTFKLPIF